MSGYVEEYRASFDMFPDAAVGYLIEQSQTDGDRDSEADSEQSGAGVETADDVEPWYETPPAPNFDSGYTDQEAAAIVSAARQKPVGGKA